MRRVGKAGYLALGPDGLTSLGGYPGTDEEGREMQSSLAPEKLMEDFFASFQYLVDHPDSTGRVGAVGFCYGGGVCNALAVAFPEMGASVPFYGRQPATADVPAIQAPLLLHYAGLDERVNEGLAGLRGGAEGERQGLRGVHLPGREPRVPQRHDAALRPGGGRTRLGAHARLVRAAPADAAAGLRRSGRPNGRRLEGRAQPPAVLQDPHLVSPASGRACRLPSGSGDDVGPGHAVSPTTCPGGSRVRGR